MPLSKDGKSLRRCLKKAYLDSRSQTKDRDAIQEIQQEAIAGTFDIQLVFMFDRLGRRDDEPPFVVEWFVRNGIEVWSTEEGQQRFDNHLDKLMNYIRYWQASGESIKTSIQTRTRLGQIVQEGRYRGGTCPYGYRLEKQGRINKKNHEVYELVVDEQESAVVKLIFDKYVNEGFGAQRLVRFLLDQGIRNRKGDNFANTTLIKMLRNIMYTGVMRSGESFSQPFEHLRIIDQDTFDQAQKIMKERTQPHSEIPLNTKAKVLLSGLIYCDHCGSKLILTTSHSCGNVRYRYQCRHPQSCDGQTGYATAKLDSIVEETLLNLFDEIRSVPVEDVVSKKYQQNMELLKWNLKNAKSEYLSKSKELDIYETEISRAIIGESQWDSALLQKMIRKAQETISDAEVRIKEIQNQIKNASSMSAEIQKSMHRLLAGPNFTAQAP